MLSQEADFRFVFRRSCSKIYSKLSQSDTSSISKKLVPGLPDSVVRIQRDIAMNLVANFFSTLCSYYIGRESYYREKLYSAAK